MKKVLLGILIIIPIIVVLITAAVVNFVSVSAYIAVEGIEITSKTQEENVTLEFASLGGGETNINNYVDIAVHPTGATNKIIEWSLIGIKCLDSDYEESYRNYLSGPENNQKVYPCVMLVDDNGDECDSNTTGKIKINSYCQFSAVATIENFSSSVFIIAGGHKPTSVVISSDRNILPTGEKVKLKKEVFPLDSIVERTVWVSSDESVAVVDANGIVTAKRTGKTEITVSVYGEEDSSVTSTAYQVTVENGISFFGNAFCSHLTSFSLSEAGITDASSVSGCTITGDTLTFDGTHAVISSGERNIDIYLCDEDEIVIENAEFFEGVGNNVIDKDGEKCILNAKYKSVFKEGIPQVTWASSDENIASVNDGIITCNNKGIVTITTDCGGKTASCEFMIIETVTTISLITSDEYYSDVIGGLAKEVVFASYRYTDSETDDRMENNFTYIEINGVKGLSGEALDVFLDNYNFEIVSGNEYAYFDTEKRNKLIFTPSLEGKGKQEIKVRVSAKYPRYQSMKQYCTEDVTIKAVYGVEANTYRELKYAASYQEKYAKADGNVIHSINDPVLSTLSDYDTVSSSERRFAVSLMNRIDYPTSFGDPLMEGTTITRSCPRLYGDLYGNNNMLHCTSVIHVAKYSSVLWVLWSDVTISNVIIRSNDLEGDTLDSDNPLWGKCFDIWSGMDLKLSGEEEWDAYYRRITGITVEYSIFENCQQVGRIMNADVNMNGCVIRNVAGIGLHLSHAIKDINGQKVPAYEHVTFNNMVFSNSLGPLMSVFSEGYTKDKNGNNYFSSDDNENLRIIKEDYIDKGRCTKVYQTGFMDVYNWQSLDSVQLVKTGNEQIDNLVAAAVSSILITDPAVEKFRYRYKNETWLNVGIMVSGVNSNDSLSTEPILSEFTFEDDRFLKISLSEMGKGDALEALLSGFPIDFYCYGNGANIKPSTVYVLNSKYINRLHGEAQE